MNGPFKGISAALWSYDDRGGRKTRRYIGRNDQKCWLYWCWEPWFSLLHWKPSSSPSGRKTP